MILVSSLPDIVLVKTIHTAPSWLVFAKMGMLLALIVGWFAWKPLQRLRRCWIILFAFLAFSELRPRIDFNFSPMQSLFGGSALDARMQGEQTSKFTVTLAIIGALLILGYRQRDFFLARGNLLTRIEPVRWLGFPKPDPWPSFGLQWGFYIAAGLFAVHYPAFRPSSATLTRLTPILPSILCYAALNAFNEELTFRAPLLATLEPVCGSKNALWISACFFGIAHYFGTPGGISGVVASTFMGWILGKVMIETRGLFWAWWIHFLSDIVIFFFLAASLKPAM